MSSTGAIPKIARKDKSNMSSTGAIPEIPHNDTVEVTFTLYGSSDVDLKHIEDLDECDVELIELNYEEVEGFFKQNADDMQLQEYAEEMLVKDTAKLALEIKRERHRYRKEYKMQITKCNESNVHNKPGKVFNTWCRMKHAKEKMKAELAEIAMKKLFGDNEEEIDVFKEPSKEEYEKLKYAFF